MMHPDLASLQQSLREAMGTCIRLSGRSILPCVPEILDEAVQLIDQLFIALGNPIPEVERLRVAEKIASLVQAADQITPYSRLVIDYGPSDPPITGHSITVSRQEENLPVSGKLVLPCLPALVEHSVQMADQLFTALGNQFSQEELANFRAGLTGLVEQAFQTSANSQIIIDYRPADPPATGLACSVSINPLSMADRYREWLSTREPPLFGTYPDARVIDVARLLGNPAEAAVLDVGAGTGRNCLPLARIGFWVDAIEPVPEFVQQLEAAAQKESLQLRVIPIDILDPAVQLPPAVYHLAIASELVSHFRDMAQVRLLLAKLADTLQPGGWLLFNGFLAQDGYEPDERIRQLSQMSWSFIMTRSELRSAMADLPLEMVADDSAHDFEKAHLPIDLWPPTSWFPDWSQGYNLFPKQPPDNLWMELRWILCRRL